MNEVPLIQNVQKNDINTSIIAIKKQLKQLIEAVGLIESPNSPDMSPYVKKTDIVDYVQIGNQNPVTSNGVYVALTELEERIDENIVDNVENGDLRPVTSNAVSQSISYSTSEVKTGATWIDGRPIYKKTVDTGALPSSSGDKLVNHNISNLDMAIHFEGFAFSPTSKVSLNLPHVANNTAYNIAVDVRETQIVINVGTNRSAYSISYVTIFYVKTTD